MAVPIEEKILDENFKTLHFLSKVEKETMKAKNQVNNAFYVNMLYFLYEIIKRYYEGKKLDNNSTHTLIKRSPQYFGEPLVGLELIDELKVKSLDGNSFSIKNYYFPGSCVNCSEALILFSFNYNGFQIDLQLDSIRLQIDVEIDGVLQHQYVYNKWSKDANTDDKTCTIMPYEGDKIGYVNIDEVLMAFKKEDWNSIINYDFPSFIKNERLTRS